jgi:hypothetical protein
MKPASLHLVFRIPSYRYKKDFLVKEKISLHGDLLSLLSNEAKDFVQLSLLKKEHCRLYIVIALKIKHDLGLSVNI